MNSDNSKSQKFFRKHSLKVGNRITNAAGLTLRETIFPLFLVTILYFLWVRRIAQNMCLAYCFLRDLHMASLIPSTSTSRTPLASLEHAPQAFKLRILVLILWRRWDTPTGS